MKFIKVLFMVVLILIVTLIVGLFIFVKTLDLNRYKSQITRKVSEVLGREVTMKHLALSLSLNRGVRLNLSGLTVQDHPDFSTDPMLYVDSAYLNVDIAAFILSRRITVSNIELNSFRVNLVRDNEGEVNVQKLADQVSPPPAAAPAVTPPAAGQAPEEISKPKTTDSGLEMMMVRSILITDGTVVFNDRSSSPPMTIPIENIKLEVSDVSVNGPFPFKFSASLWSGRPNIAVTGSVHVNLQNQQVRVDDLKVQSDLSDLVLEQIYQSVPAVQGLGLKGGLAGRVEGNIHPMIVGAEGLLVLSSDVRLTGGKVQMESLPVPIENVNILIEATETDARIKEMTVPFASGQVDVSGRVMDYLKEQKFLGEVSIQGVDLSLLTAGAGLPVNIQGRLYGDFKAQGRGFVKEALESSLVGEGTLEVKEGRLADINILNVVLSKISFIPDLAAKVEQSLPEQYKEKLKRKDTVLEKVVLETRVLNNELVVNRAEINADGFLVTAQGKLGFNQDLSVTADLYIPEELSAAMAGAVQELSYFIDEQHRIHIPLKPYQGKLDRFQMYPDVEDVVKRAFKNRAAEELRKVFNRMNGAEETPAAQGTAEGAGQEPRAPGPEEAIIENILDAIPIFK
jgi:hypothetical protein